MNKRYLLFGGLIIGALAIVKKYTNFVDKLSFNIKKAKIKAPFPYNNINLIVSCEIINPTSTSVVLKQLFGTLKYQGKTLCSIEGGYLNLKQGVNNFNVTANFSTANFEEISDIRFDYSQFSTLYYQLIRTPFQSDITYVTNLGTFNSVDDWKLQELL